LSYLVWIEHIATVVDQPVGVGHNTTETPINYLFSCAKRGGSGLAILYQKLLFAPVAMHDLTLIVSNCRKPAHTCMLTVRWWLS